jgi:hypothetical protein
LLPDGSFLHVDDADLFPYLTRHWVGRPRPQAAFAYPESPTLRMNDPADFERTFPGHRFQGWLPRAARARPRARRRTCLSPSGFLGRWLARDGDHHQDERRHDLSRSRTPFPGFGFLFLATNGELEGVGPLTIEPSPDGNGCTDAGECTSASAWTACVASPRATEPARHALVPKKGRAKTACAPSSRRAHRMTPASSSPSPRVVTTGRAGAAALREVPGRNRVRPRRRLRGTCCSRALRCPLRRRRRGRRTERAGAEDACEAKARSSKANGRRRIARRIAVPLGADHCASPCESNRDCVGGNVCASGRCRAVSGRDEDRGLRLPGSGRIEIPACSRPIGYFAALAFPRATTCERKARMAGAS